MPILPKTGNVLFHGVALPPSPVSPNQFDELIIFKQNLIISDNLNFFENTLRERPIALVGYLTINL